MGANFSGLSIALAGLRSARRSMDVAAGNVANAQNPEYARRRVVNGLTPPGEDALPLASSEGLYLQRITDEFYESRALTESASASQLTRASEMLADLERTVPEPSDSGLAATMGRFFDAFDDVAMSPGDLPVRQVVVTAAQDAASAFNLASSQMSRVRSDAVGRLGLVTSEVNSLADRLADLNRAIVEANAAGNDPGVYLDERDTSARRLAELVGGRTEPGPRGTVGVTVGSGTMVFDTVANHMRVADTGTSVSLQWDGPAFTGPVSGQVSGEARAYLDFANTVLPARIAQLDAAATAFATQVNALHSAGFSQDGTTGLALFTGSTAATLAVDPTIVSDPAKLAVGATNAPLDTTVASRIADLATAPTGPLAQFRSFVTRLGSDVRLSQQQAEVQVGVLGQIDMARASSRGVSIDEEVASIVEFQRAYEASAKVIQVFDTTMDALMSIVR